MEDAIRRKLAANPGKRDDTEDGRAETGSDSLLDRVESPADVRKLSRDELEQLCGEIREFIIDVVSQKGGHLGSSLGVVELTVALHHVLDLPSDRIVWDTGHQAYVHKVLTGRKEALWNIRHYGGISGFLKRSESPYDHFGAGHASTAISAALGMATARDLVRHRHRVVGIIGDGAMTGGLAYEALNNAGQSGRPLLVVLNDNGMSIAPNVGALASYLTSVKANPHLKKLRDEMLATVRRLPMGDSVGSIAERLESGLKNVLVPGALFEALGFSYFGPLDGHDLDALLDLLPRVLQRRGPVLLHLLTTKGKGLPQAEADDESFHGVVPFDRSTGKALSGKPSPTPAYTAVFGDALLKAADAHPDVVAITAAMPTGTGLNEFQRRHPERFFDVGIAEAHAVCFAAGMACEGARPVVAVYSTFLQRAFDQIVHDVAIQKLPVVFALDRGGLVGADGPTHHGVLDLSYLRCIPGLVVAAPRDGNELRDLLWTALDQDAAPFAFRFPRGAVPPGYDSSQLPQVIPIGSWDRLSNGPDVALLAVGTMVTVALQAGDRLAERGIGVTVVNCRFVKPMDREILRSVRQECPLLVTLEENNLPGGFGDGVAEILEAEGLSRDGVIRVGLPDAFVTHGSREELLRDVGLTPADVERVVVEALGGQRGPAGEGEADAHSDQ